MQTLPTTRIKSKKSTTGVLINERDFDPAKHERFAPAAKADADEGTTPKTEKTKP